MMFRWPWILCYVFVALTSPGQAGIYRWDSGEVISGTENIELGPQLQLRNRDLAFANLSDNNLSGSYFDYSNLARAKFANADLTGASFYNAKLENADFLGSIITNAIFVHSTVSMDQIYSTASYADRDLRGIWLTGHDLTGWNFSGQDLSGAWLGATKLDHVDFTGTVVAGTFLGTANLTREQLYSTASYQAKELRGITLSHNNLTGWDFSEQDLTGADLSASSLTNAVLAGSIVTQANFANFVGGLSKEQLYSTASYRLQDLHGITLSALWGSKDLSGWDLSQQNLTQAVFAKATLTNTDLRGAIVTNADFGGTASTQNLTKEQLYSTASYQSKSLRQIKLNGFADPYNQAESDLTGWDFSGQDLTGADLSLATFNDVNLTGALVAGVNFSHTTKQGLTKEQFYSTGSYRAKDLAGIAFTGDYCCSHDDLTGWNFSEQDLSGAHFYRAILADANLSGANLVNAWLFDPNGSADRAILTNANLTSADTRGSRGLHLADAISRNTILPDGKIMGLDLNSGERLLVRDDDGVPAAGFESWPPPRESIPITIYDHMTLADGSELQLRFDADPWNSLISFEPSIPVEIRGELLLTFVSDVDVASQVGRTLQVFDWNSVSPSGTFVINSPYTWDLSNLYTTGAVRLKAVPEPGGIVAGLFALTVVLISSRLSSAHRR